MRPSTFSTVSSFPRCRIVPSRADTCVDCRLPVRVSLSASSQGFRMLLPTKGQDVIGGGGGHWPHREPSVPLHHIRHSFIRISSVDGRKCYPSPPGGPWSWPRGSGVDWGPPPKRTFMTQ